jgi:transcriptional regulator with XRE-family HTH domain
MLSSNSQKEGVIYMATIGDRVREIREKLKMTQDQLADAAKVSKGFLSDVENSKRNVSSEYLLKIANALGASVDYLLQGQVKESKDKEPVVIPPELSRAAEEIHLSYSERLNSLMLTDRSLRDEAISR